MSLHIRFVPTRPIYTDNNSGSDMNVCIYEPVLPTDDGNTWYFLGHSATPLPAGHHPLNDSLLSSLSPIGIAIRSDDPTALASASPNQKLWTDQNSGGDQNLELYSIQASQASNNPFNQYQYVALGLFASLPNNYGDDPTTQSSWKNICLVRSDLTQSPYQSNNQTRVWSDSGSGSNGNGIWNKVSFWNTNISNNNNSNVGIYPMTFLASSEDSSNYQDNQPYSTTPTIALLEMSGVTLSGYPVWMSNYSSYYANNPLQKICLPATHDSGTYALTPVLDNDGQVGNYINPRWVIIKAATTAISNIEKLAEFIGSETIIPWFIKAVWPALQAMSTATRKSVLHQLLMGIRCFDFRVYYHEQDFYIGHGGLIGSKLKDVFADIQYFLNITNGEIVYITVGHWTNFGFTPTDETNASIYQQFANLLNSYFQNNLYSSDNVGPEGDLFEQTYSSIVGSPAQSKIIVVCDLSDNEMSQYGISGFGFFNRNYDPPSSGIGDTAPIDFSQNGVYGFYTDTEDQNTMAQTQKTQFQEACAHSFPFALYLTLTPGTPHFISNIVRYVERALFGGFLQPVIAGFVNEIIDGICDIAKLSSDTRDEIHSYVSQPGWDSIESLSAQVGHDVASLVNRNFVNSNVGNQVSLVYVDYFENTQIVDVAIGLSVMPLNVSSNDLLTPAVPNASDDGKTLPYNYYENTIRHIHAGGRVWLSSTPDGLGDLFTDDQATIEVTGADQVMRAVTIWGGPTPPTDITHLFRYGVNKVKITLTDINPPYYSSWAYYLFHQPVAFPLQAARNGQGGPAEYVNQTFSYLYDIRGRVWLSSTPDGTGSVTADGLITLQVTDANNKTRTYTYPGNPQGPVDVSYLFRQSHNKVTLTLTSSESNQQNCSAFYLVYEEIKPLLLQTAVPISEDNNLALPHDFAQSKANYFLTEEMSVNGSLFLVATSEVGDTCYSNGYPALNYGWEHPEWSVNTDDQAIISVANSPQGAPQSLTLPNNSQPEIIRLFRPGQNAITLTLTDITPSFYSSTPYYLVWRKITPERLLWPAGGRYINTVNYTYLNGRMWLSSTEDGTGSIAAYGTLNLTVTDESGAQHQFTWEYDSSQPTRPPVELTYLFRQGMNAVSINITGYDANNNSPLPSDYFLVCLPFESTPLLAPDQGETRLTSSGQVTVPYQSVSGRVWLSSNTNGTAPISFEGALTIQTLNKDTNVTQSEPIAINTSPIEITSLFSPGQIEVTLFNSGGSYTGSDIYLVHTAY